MNQTKQLRNPIKQINVLLLQSILGVIENGSSTKSSSYEWFHNNLGLFDEFDTLFIWEFINYRNYEIDYKYGTEIWFIDFHCNILLSSFSANNA